MQRFNMRRPARQMVKTGGVKLKFILLMIIAGLMIFVWPNLQLIVDYINGRDFQASPELSQLMERIKLTDRSQLVLKASHPQFQTKEQFNQNCPRREASLYILGCYNGRDIFVYQVDNQELAGISEVTLAHELLHAVYRRLEPKRQAQLNRWLVADYQRLVTDELKQRMAAYERTQPGQFENELHSILGTEFEGLSPELERYYKQIFLDRQAIVAMYQQSQRPFQQKQQAMEQIKAAIEQQEKALGLEKAAYDQRVSEFNQRVEQFNQRASRSGGFTTQSEFATMRAQLVATQQQLQVQRQHLVGRVATLNQQIDQYNQINLAIQQLNRSLDSLAEPTLHSERH